MARIAKASTLMGVFFAAVLLPLSAGAGETLYDGILLPDEWPPKIDRWCMADSSWGCVFPGADGKLMSVAQCHADAETKHRVQQAYLARARDVASATDDLLVGRRYAGMTDVAAPARKVAEHASDLCQNLLSGRAVGKLGERLWAFGVMNMPLPQ